jgi:hypothetical protein
VTLLPSSKRKLSALGMSMISELYTHGPFARVPTHRLGVAVSAQGSLPTCLAVALVGRDSHPLDDDSAFPKYRSPFLQTGIAWSHVE